MKVPKHGFRASARRGFGARSGSSRRKPPMTPKPLKALLLDIDGTLIDSNDAHTQAWRQALREAGHALAHDAIRPLIGKGGDKLLAELVQLDIDAEPGKTISARRREIFIADHLPALQATPGARALLEWLVAHGLRLIVATSATPQELGQLLKQAGVDDLIEQSVGSEDAPSTKPDPDIVLAALTRGGLRADEVLMVGDTPYDVQAAAAAGVPTLALRCGGWWTDGAFGGAAAIHDDPAALLRRIDESPIGRRLPAGTA